MFSSCKSVRMLFENKRKGEETMMKQMTRNKAAGRKNKKKSMQWAAAVMALALTGMNASEMAAMIPMQVKAAETARPQSAVRYILPSSTERRRRGAWSSRE